MKHILVFTDLDGSLLDHHNYDWRQATPALDILKREGIPVIINSSKTSAEILKLKQRLDNHDPFISENGAVAHLPNELLGSSPAVTNYAAQYFATPYAEIIATLQKLRAQYNFSFTGFFDMDAQEIATICDLKIEDARDAKSREASEPLLWQDSEDRLAQFTGLLKEHGLIIVKGGRFYHVMSEVNKGNTLLWVKEQYQSAQPDTHWITIGLGDSFNDVAMLNVVDYPVLINNPAIKQPDLSQLSNLYTSSESGPAGWNEAINKLTKEIL